MLRVELQLSSAQAALAQVPQEVALAIAEKVRLLTLTLQHHIVADKLQGQVLHHRTGNLSRSIQTEVSTSGMITTGSVFSSGDVKYAAIHEFGFNGTETVHEHMRSMVFGKEVEPFSVGPYQRHVNMPERSFMRSSLSDMAEEIVNGLKAAALAGAKRAMA